MLRKGIDGSEIIEKTYFEKTYIQNQILGRALLESMLVLEKQVVVSVVSRKEMEFFEAVQAIWRNRGSASADKRCGSGDFSA